MPMMQYADYLPTNCFLTAMCIADTMNMMINTPAVNTAAASIHAIDSRVTAQAKCFFETEIQSKNLKVSINLEVLICKETHILIERC